jgi:hypothetical protein
MGYMPRRPVFGNIQLTIGRLVNLDTEIFLNGSNNSSFVVPASADISVSMKVLCVQVCIVKYGKCLIIQQREPRVNFLFRVLIQMARVDEQNVNQVGCQALEHLPKHHVIGPVKCSVGDVLIFTEIYVDTDQFRTNLLVDKVEDSSRLAAPYPKFNYELGLEINAHFVYGLEVVGNVRIGFGNIPDDISMRHLYLKEYRYL